MQKATNDLINYNGVQDYDKVAESLGIIKYSIEKLDNDEITRIYQSLTEDIKNHINGTFIDKAGKIELPDLINDAREYIGKKSIKDLSSTLERITGKSLQQNDETIQLFYQSLVSVHALTTMCSDYKNYNDKYKEIVEKSREETTTKWSEFHLSGDTKKDIDKLWKIVENTAKEYSSLQDVIEKLAGYNKKGLR